MDRVVIIGSPGAGKTMLARKLGDILGIEEVYHLDRYFWDSGWHELPRSRRIEIQHRLIKENPRWIIEGTYLSSSDERLNAADAIIFLDIPWPLCLFRVLKRRIEYHNKPRPDLPEGCSEKIRFLYLLKVLVFPLRGRRLFLKKQKEIKSRQANEVKKTQFYWFRSSKAVDNFLHELRIAQEVLPVSSTPVTASAVRAEDMVACAAL
jgi:adenylate kinase family enzyme